MKMLTGKVALITGASSGIGAATAVLFSKLGAKVALSGRNEENLRRTAEKCEKELTTNKPLLVPGDLSMESDTQNIMENTLKHYGKLDVLVNNAGILDYGSIENTSLAQYDRVMGVNVRSMYHLTMLAVPHLVLTRGSIVNVSSLSGLRSFANQLAYNMSKSTVDQFTRCVALELAPKQVRVNSVNPGVTITEIHKRGGMSEDKYLQFLEHSKTTHALGQAGNADEIASAIAFLASDSASFITGVQLPVDGGRQVMCPH